MNVLKNIINSVKKAIDDKALCLSAGFNKFLTDIARNFSQDFRRNPVIKVVWNDPKETAYTDGDKCVINANCALVTHSYGHQATRIEKVRSIIAMLLHEMSHVQNTSFEVWKTVVDKFRTEKTLWPICELDPKNYENATDVIDALNGKYGEFIFSMFSNFENGLEDSYVNTRVLRGKNPMRGNLSWFLKKTLHEKRNYTLEMNTKLMESGRVTKYQIESNMVWLYGVFGVVLCEPDKLNPMHPMVQNLVDVCKDIDLVKTTHDPYEREALIQKIFCHYWPSLKEWIELAEQNNQQPQDNSGQEQDGQTQRATGNAGTGKQDNGSSSNSQSQKQSAKDKLQKNSQNKSSKGQSSDDDDAEEEDGSSQSGKNSGKSKKNAGKSTDSSGSSKAGKKDGSGSDSDEDSEETEDGNGGGETSEEETDGGSNESESETDGSGNGGSDDSDKETDETDDDGESTDGSDGSDDSEEETDETDDDGESTDESGNSDDSNEDSDDANDDGMSNAMKNAIKRGQNTLSGNDPDEGVDEDDTEEEEEESSDSDTDDSEAVQQMAEQIQQLVEKIAKDAVGNDEETAMMKAMDSINMLRGNTVEGIKTNNEVVKHREVDKQSFTATWPSLKRTSDAFVKMFRQKIKDKSNGRKLSGFFYGQTISYQAIARREDAVFEQKKLPSDYPRLAVAYLGDESGSMYGSIEAPDGTTLQKFLVNRECALIVHESLVELGIPCAVYGHDADGGWDGVNVNFKVYADFVPKKDDKYRIMQITASGGNRDGDALRKACDLLLQQPAEHRVLIITSDGMPSAYTAEEDGVRMTADVVKEYTRKGVKFIACAMDEDKERIHDIYGDAYLDITDITKMPQKIIHVLSQYITV